MSVVDRSIPTFRVLDGTRTQFVSSRPSTIDSRAFASVGEPYPRLERSLVRAQAGLF